MKQIEIIKPGMFGNQAADSRRLEFDSKNEELITMEKKIDMVFIGDSITHAWELGAYFDQQENLLINRGIGGDTPFYVAKRFKADVLQLNPACAAILCGINETWELNGLSGEKLLEVSSNCEERIINAYRDIAEQSAAWKLKLNLCSILPVYGEDTEYAEARKMLILNVNRKIKFLADQYKWIYVDYHHNLCEHDGRTLRKELSNDGCHVNAMGYAVMAETIREAVKKISIEI